MSGRICQVLNIMLKKKEKILKVNNKIVVGGVVVVVVTTIGFWLQALLSRFYD